MKIPNDVLKKYNVITLEEYEQFFPDIENKEEAIYREFLEKTDYIPLKIFESFIEDMAEASILGTIGVIVDFFKDIKVTYNNALAYRKLAREEINKLGE